MMFCTHHINGFISKIRSKLLFLSQFENTIAQSVMKFVSCYPKTIFDGNYSRTRVETEHVVSPVNEVFIY